MKAALAVAALFALFLGAAALQKLWTPVEQQIADHPPSPYELRAVVLPLTHPTEPGRCAEQWIQQTPPPAPPACIRVYLTVNKEQQQ